jgi:hypothetical protein
MRELHAIEVISFKALIDYCVVGRIFNDKEFLRRGRV